MVLISFCFDRCKGDSTVCTSPPPFAGGGGGLNLLPIFQKGRGGLTGPQFSEEGCRERGGWLFSGGVAIFGQNKLKSGMFNGKKSLWTRILCSDVTKNSNWEILTMNVVTFKR